MISKNDHSPVSKALGQSVWMHGTEAIFGKVHLNIVFGFCFVLFLQRESAKPCGNT